MQISRENFEEQLTVFQHILSSDKTEFVAFDFEMTGIRTTEKEVFNDLPFERYEKCSQVGRKYQLIQAGITIFQKESEDNYIAHPFNAFVIQQKIPGTYHKPELNLESGGIRFNAQHGMDFDFWIKNGVNFLDRQTQRKLVKQVEESKSYDDKKEILKAIEQSVGFTRVFEILRARNVPLVGHNCYMDLIFLHQAFYGPLPQEYMRFEVDQPSEEIDPNVQYYKQNVKDFLGNVFDSKTIANAHLRDIMPAENSSTSLEKIKEFIYSDLVNLRKVHVKLAVGCEDYDWDIEGNGKKFHEAGFDSYLTGWVFLQLKKLYITRHEGVDNEKFAHIFINKINVLNNRFFFCIDRPDDVPQHSVKVGGISKDVLLIYGLKNVANKGLNEKEYADLVWKKVNGLQEDILAILSRDKYEVGAKVNISWKRFVFVELFLENIKDLELVEKTLKTLESDKKKMRGLADEISIEQYSSHVFKERSKRNFKPNNKMPMKSN